MPAHSSARRAAEPEPAGHLPPWLSVVCDDPELARSVGRYLRYLAPGLAHLGPEALRLELRVVDPGAIPPVPRGATAVGRRDRYVVARHGQDLIYHLEGEACVRVDGAGGRASLWTAHAADQPDAVPGLVSIALLEVAARRGLFGLHAGAVAHEGTGYLLPGASGSGKTSLCLTMVRAGFRYLTDDFVLLTVGDGALRCVPFFRTFNLDVAWAERFPELSFIGDLRPLPHGKRMIDPERFYPGSHAESARPGVLLFPAIVAGPDSAVRPLPKREAFCRLLPQSRLSADPGVAQAHLRVLERLVHAAPAFELLHGRDFLRAPEATLRRLLERVEGPAEAGRR